MDLLKPFKDIKNKITDKVTEMKDEAEKKSQEQQKLMDWKSKLNTAMSVHDSFRKNTAIWDKLYGGSKEMNMETNIYMSDRDTDTRKAAEARQVVNLTFQLIESQIDVSVPLPRVDPLELDDEEKTDMIEGQLTYLATGTELERVVSENERIVKKNSLAVMKVSYDPDFKGHSFRGRIKTTNPHPNNIIPQPNIYKVEDMDYMFHVETRSLDYICREYGEDFRYELEEEGAEYEYLEAFTSSTNQSSDKGRLSVVEAWYKDKDGDIGVLTWCNDTILKDTPKFYYKRDEQGEIITTEELTIENADPITGEVIQEVINVECYVPKRFPFIIWYNIPREKSFIGLSDPYIIIDQQQGIKKMLSIAEEKQINGTSKIFTRKGTGIKNQLTNAISQVLEVDNPKEDINVIDLKTPDNSLIELYQIYTQAAKDSLGVTDASQGRADSSTLSGKALEQLASYSQGRQTVKIFEKQIAFKELYRLYFDFLLAFYDDKVPFKIKGEDNQNIYGYFDKTKLVKKDIAGEYYFPDFDIYISADSGINKDKNFILQQAQEDFRIGAIDAVEYWTIKESVGFPNASVILDMEKQKLEQQQMLEQQNQAMQQQQQQLGLQQQQLDIHQQANSDPNILLQQELAQLPPEDQEYIKSLPPEKQQALIDKYIEMQKSKNK